MNSGSRNVFIFHNHEVLQQSWNLHSTSTKNYENLTESVNSLVSKMKTSIGTSEPQTKQYPVVPVSQPTLLSLLYKRVFFSWCGWVVCLPAYPIFCCLVYDVTWCQKYCPFPGRNSVIASWNVYMLWQCQLIAAIAGQWQAKKNLNKNLFSST
jgi:hypothetical protein